MEFRAKTGKSIKQLIADLYAKVGSFSSDRYDLHIDQATKEKVIANCQNNAYNNFGSYVIQDREDLDGFKYHFDENCWTMIRPSGTEPALRVNAQAPNHKEVINILEAVKAELLG